MTRARRRVDHVVLYDVDPVNPYGRELAAVLTDVVPSVSLVGSRALSWCPQRVTLRPWLAAQRSASSAVAVVVRRLTGALRAALLLADRHTILVVVWSRDFWDATVLALVAMMTGRLVVVDHNPAPQRRHSGLKGRAERALRRQAARVVVHDAAFEPDASGSTTAVAPHPAYLEWRRRFLPTDPPQVPSRVLFLGALRWDKGVGEMPAVINGLPSGTQLRVIGPGEIPAAWHQAASKRDVVIDHLGGGAVVDDVALGRALADGGVVVAPYVGATQSGSVALAVSCGLPVLGYDAGALPALLTDEALVPSGSPEALAALVTSFLSRPWPTARVQLEEMSRECAAAWRELLAPLVDPEHYVREG